MWKLSIKSYGPCQIGCHYQRAAGMGSALRSAAHGFVFLLLRCAFLSSDKCCLHLKIKTFSWNIWFLTQVAFPPSLKSFLSVTLTLRIFNLFFETRILLWRPDWTDSFPHLLGSQAWCAMPSSIHLYNEWVCIFKNVQAGHYGTHFNPSTWGRGQQVM